jgi:RNA polymerase sigma factor (TIGR02999 family)
MSEDAPSSSAFVGVTVLLERIRQGSAEAKDELVGKLYDRFRQRAAGRLLHERSDLSLTASDITNEALLRLLKNDELAKAKNTNELFRAFSRAMRQLLIDHARKKKAEVHGGDRRREPLDDLLVVDFRNGRRVNVLDLDEAISVLAEQHPREANAMELRYYGGYEMAEIAELLNVSLRTAERDCRFARAWLLDFLSPEDGV